jgi:hypothetical protein
MRKKHPKEVIYNTPFRRIKMIERKLTKKEVKMIKELL